MNRFEKAYNALFDAYSQGTLASGVCTACAVGNIVAAAQGGIITKSLNCEDELQYDCTTNSAFWSELFITPFKGAKQTITLVNSSAIKELENLTGYSVEEMATVERLFESNTEYTSARYKYMTEEEIKKDQFNGLSVVLNYLSTLEEKSPVNYMEKFEQHLELCEI